MLKIAYVFDENIRILAADTEQVMNTVSALSKIKDVSVTLFLPSDNTRGDYSLEEVQKSYGINGKFDIRSLKTLNSKFRVAEKAAYAVVCAAAYDELKNYDVVYCRNISVAVTCVSMKIPVFYDTYRPWPKQFPILNPVFSYLMRNDAFLGMGTHSAYTRGIFRQMGMPDEKIIVAYNGYDEDKFSPVLSRKAAARKLSLPDNTIITYAGRISSAKGTDIILDLAKHFPDCLFLMIGPVDDDTATRAENIANIRMLGHKSFTELPAYLYASDILIIPPTLGPLHKVGNTVLPIKVFSYLGAGRPIFAPAAPDTAELLRHRENACLVEPDNLRAAVDGLQNLLSDKELRSTLEKNAAQTASGLTWSARAARLTDFIRKRLRSL